MRRHEFQAPPEEQGNNGVWGDMAGYSFTAMRQFSCDSSSGPPNPCCLFAWHIQAAWPFSCLSVYRCPLPPLGTPCPRRRCHVDGGGETPLTSQQPLIQTSPTEVEVAVRDFPRYGGSASYLTKMLPPLGIERLKSAQCHAQLVDIRTKL